MPFDNLSCSEFLQSALHDFHVIRVSAQDFFLRFKGKAACDSCQGDLTSMHLPLFK